MGPNANMIAADQCFLSIIGQQPGSYQIYLSLCQLSFLPITINQGRPLGIALASRLWQTMTRLAILLESLLARRHLGRIAARLTGGKNKQYQNMY